VAARVFTAVAKAGVNVLMIAQGSSEVNISFVVSRNDAKNAAKALHDEFVLRKK
jgi:aspartate kinase